jgi:hypothetical protein
MNTNLYTNGFLLILKIFFHNIRCAPFDNHCSNSSRRLLFRFMIISHSSLLYCDVHAVGQQSTVETLVYNRC